MRFETHMADEALDGYAQTINLRTDAIFGAFDDGLEMRGAAHVALYGGMADLGLSVEQGYRGQGIGSRLLEKAIDWSRLRRAKTFSSQCLTHNRWMMAKVTKLGFDVVRDMDTAVATTQLEPPDLALVGKAVLDEQLGQINFGTKLWFSLIPGARLAGFR